MAGGYILYSPKPFYINWNTITQFWRTKCFLLLFSLNMPLSIHRYSCPSFYNRAILLAIRLATTVLHPSTSYAFLIQTTQDNHEAAEALRDLIKTDGAGSWPPKASHRDSWPAPLRLYHDIFLELAPLLPVDQISTDDTFHIGFVSRIGLVWSDRKACAFLFQSTLIESICNCRGY